MSSEDRPLYIPYFGAQLLETSLLNKSSAFTNEERREFKLHGLVPERVETIDEQVSRSYKQFKEQATDLDKHIYLRSLQDSNTTLFYKLLTDYLEEMLPIVYTPTVGLACELFSKIYSHAKGLFLSYPHRDRIPEILRNISRKNIRVVVITDGERILGLGDQGIGGMGIPIGKLSLYTACGGISPANTLPIVIDVGTNNAELLKDPVYMGWRHNRIDGEEYFKFVDMLIREMVDVWPNLLIQFEDFALPKANKLLSDYRDKYCCFNDDIQGTAAITLATIISYCKEKGEKVSDQRFVFSGAGSAGCGIAHQVVSYMVLEEGLEILDAKSKICIMNSSGLLFNDSNNLYDFQRSLAQPRSIISSWPHGVDTSKFIEVVRYFKPSVLVGVSGQYGLYSKEIIDQLLEFCDRPLVLPLSNPISRSEGSPDDIIKWSKGRAAVATGSPYPPVIWNNKTIRITQCNNVYIFPGIGLGVLISRAKRVTDKMLMAAALTLAEYKYTTDSLLPPISIIREVSHKIALNVALKAVEEGVATAYREDQLKRRIKDNVWDPSYRSYKLRSI